MFPSSLLLYCSNRLDPVQINSLLGIWMGIICRVFLLVGCVLGCQQLRRWYRWRRGWEPWPRADLSEHPVPERDYIQHPLPAVADEAEAEGTQVNVFAWKFSGSLTVTLLPVREVFQCKLEGLMHRNDEELLGKHTMRMLRCDLRAGCRQRPQGGKSAGEVVSWNHTVAIIYWSSASAIQWSKERLLIMLTDMFFR